jgi:hypothetical protein
VAGLPKRRSLNNRSTGAQDETLPLPAFPPAAIQAKRAEIARKLIAGSANIKDHTISRIAAADLKLLFALYNEFFFDNRFWQVYRGKLQFSLSRRLTRSAGKTLCPRNIDRLRPEEVVLEIRMGVDFFFDYDAVAGPKQVNGLPSRNALEAFQLVFEHELCHVVEFINFHVSNCSRPRFKNIAKNLFGHRESNHQLPTRQRIVYETMGLRIGGAVSFMYQHQRLEGVLTKINQRATVMVKDPNGNYIDREGVKYRKYLVSVELLDPTSALSPRLE